MRNIHTLIHFLKPTTFHNEFENISGLDNKYLDIENINFVLMHGGNTYDCDFWYFA